MPGLYYNNLPGSTRSKVQRVISIPTNQPTIQFNNRPRLSMFMNIPIKNTSSSGCQTCGGGK